jgi:hypothetical protein
LFYFDSGACAGNRHLFTSQACALTDAIPVPGQRQPVNMDILPTPFNLMISGRAIAASAADYCRLTPRRGRCMTFLPA